jgi:selenide,water dikinase
MVIPPTDKNKTDSIKLTQLSHGAGCGCKISPGILEKILNSNLAVPDNKNLIVGNHSKDDAAVYDLGNGTALISTTDFFMPIVDDPFDFGKIASANAISDIYAMGGKPILAIAILGWPINKIGAEVAQKVIEGARSICLEAGIPLAGGHSIDSPEPIFGLAVNGLADIKNIKQNNKAEDGDFIFLTKPLGVGILTTAEKKGLLKEAHKNLASTQMMQLNAAGELLGKIEGVNAMTDVTGFGLLGHLIEMAEGSRLSSEIYISKIPVIIDEIKYYVEKNCIPGGTFRNWDSYGEKVGSTTDYEKSILADPQTSGGLLIAVAPKSVIQVKELLNQEGFEKFINPVGVFVSKKEKSIYINP